MATKDQITPMVTAIDQALAYFSRNLVQRPDWGKINFEKAGPDLNRAKSLLDYLKVLPLEYLPDNAIQNITARITDLTPVLKNIDNFNIETNAAPQRDTLVAQLHGVVDNFYTSASPWVPFLAYQKGDVTENIGKLNDAVKESQTIIESARRDIQEKGKEIDRIISAARTASVSAGAAVFTEDFEQDSKDSDTHAESWLKAAVGFAAATLLFAVLMLIWAYFAPDIPTPRLIQVITAKLIFLSVLIGAATWCGGIYKAKKHLSCLNRHRALSLRTLQAFSKAASDDSTKNAVLMEACRAVFTSGATGYLDGNDTGAESGLKVIEIAKTLTGKGQ